MDNMKHYFDAFKADYFKKETQIIAGFFYS